MNPKLHYLALSQNREVSAIKRSSELGCPPALPLASVIDNQLKQANVSSAVQKGNSCTYSFGTPIFLVCVHPQTSWSGRLGKHLH